MAKRFYKGGDYRDGMDVSLRRTSKKLSSYDGGEYDGRDLRRSMEKRDGGMINEDMNAIANLPQQVIYREYPKHNYMSWDLNDDITGVDQLMDENSKQHRKHGRRQGEKYETV